MEQHHIVVGGQVTERDGEHRRLGDRHLEPVHVQAVKDGGGIDRAGDDGCGLIRDVVGLVGMGTAGGGDQDGAGCLGVVILRTQRDVRHVCRFRRHAGRDGHSRGHAPALTHRQRSDCRRNGGRPGIAAGNHGKGVRRVAGVGHPQCVGHRRTRIAHSGRRGGRESQAVDRPGGGDQNDGGRPGGIAL